MTFEDKMYSNINTYHTYEYSGTMIGNIVNDKNHILKDNTFKNWACLGLAVVDKDERNATYYIEEYEL